MKLHKYILLSILLGVAISIFPQNDCGKGNQNPPQNNNDPGQTPLDDASTIGRQSVDPNEIIGPTGFDSVQWVSINDVLPYTILFENDPEFATANAQNIDVRFRFDNPSQMKGFALNSYGFANMSWEIPNAAVTYQNRIDLRDSMFIYVDLLAGIDVANQQAFWTFRSIDPDLGIAPWQVDRGMLPVNDSTHIGEGYVSFTLKPDEHLHTGDTLSIVASIVFDQNDTIPTNRWTNRIDAGAPTSSVICTVDSANPLLYHLTFSASDDLNGSGLNRIFLYQADVFGTFQEVAVCPIDTTIDFLSELGMQYQFFSIAEDNVGNREPIKQVADVVLNGNISPTDLILSDSIFYDDLKVGGYIGEFSSVDTEGSTFTYSLSEGTGAIHNDLFRMDGNRLITAEDFGCALDSVYYIRVSTTDDGGLSFSKPFVLHLRYTLEKPTPDTLAISICEGDKYTFRNVEYENAGTYIVKVPNTYMCDSVYVIQLSVLPVPEAPIITIEDGHTLVSSALSGTQWFSADGLPIDTATDQRFTPTAEGFYYACVYNGSCYSVPSEMFQVRLSLASQLTWNIPQGWNWVSTNLSDADLLDPQVFLAPIVQQTNQIVGDEMLVKSGNQLIGNLSQLQPQQSYKIELSDAVDYTWSGTAFNPNSVSISLHSGWNSLGFIPLQACAIENALAQFAPLENDIIKSFTDFAIYHAGTWHGTLTQLHPGEGYRYFTSSARTVYYPLLQSFVVEPYVSSSSRVAAASITWSYDEHLYPDNQTVIADLYNGNNIVAEGLYTVGAFVGNDCRGVGRYIDGHIFMTIHGTLSDNEIIEFKAYDHIKDSVCRILETNSFSELQLGTLNNPYEMHLALESTGLVNPTLAEGRYNVFPKPLRDRMYIIGPTEQITSLSLISMNGLRLLQYPSYSEGGIDVSGIPTGVYIVVISTATKTYWDKVTKY